MKKWSFNLESVRKHRHSLEERAATQVAAALRKLAEANDRVREVRSEFLMSTVSFFPQKESNPEFLLQLSDYHRALQMKLTEAVLREQTASNSLSQAREAWQRRRLEKEAIDKLFEQRKSEYQFRALAEEQKLLDSFGQVPQEAFES